MANAQNIDISIKNSKGKAQAYCNQNNNLTLTLTNQTGGTLNLSGGTISNPPPYGGNFGITLNFQNLFSDKSAQSNIGISSKDKNWQIQFFGSGKFPAWAIVYKSGNNYTWLNGSSIELDIQNFKPTVSPNTYSFALDLYNLNGIYVAPKSVTLMVANPPSSKKGELYHKFSAKLSNDAQVAITKNSDFPIENDLVLTLMNMDPVNPLVDPNAKPDPNPPQFIVSFIYGESPGYYALTTTENADKITMGLQTATGWNAPTAKTDPPKWVLSPTAENKEILGTKTQAFAEFSIQKLFTQFVKGPTLMYVQYINIPGYNDGFVAVPMDKEYLPMQIKNFIPNQTVFQVSYGNEAKAYLNWEVDNASLVELSGIGQVPPKQQAYEYPVEKTQQLVLAAYDCAQGQILTNSITLKTSPELSARWVPCGAISIWSGQIADIPTGWSLCDGTDNTPDLKDKFIIGAGASEEPITGGNSKHNHSFTFTGTFTIPNSGNHCHTMPSNWYARNLSCGEHTGIDTRGNYDPNSVTSGDASHGHTLPINTTVNSLDVSDNMRPSWYALCFIMKKYE